MYATRIANNQFRVSGDRTDGFVAGRRVKADQGDDGDEYFTVSSSSYDGSITTVTINETTITTNLRRVVYGTTSAGENGSLPAHTHENDDQGGSQIILTSPDTTRWVLTIDDTGAVSGTEII